MTGKPVDKTSQFVQPARKLLTDGVPRQQCHIFEIGKRSRSREKCIRFVEQSDDTDAHGISVIEQER
jgi:hypothetical protein